MLIHNQRIAVNCDFILVNFVYTCEMFQKKKKTQKLKLKRIEQGSGSF
jgi:hypothetical protein